VLLHRAIQKKKLTALGIDIRYAYTQISRLHANPAGHASPLISSKVMGCAGMTGKLLPRMPIE